MSYPFKGFYFSIAGSIKCWLRTLFAMKNVIFVIFLALMVLGAFAHDPQPVATTDMITTMNSR